MSLSDYFNVAIAVAVVCGAGVWLACTGAAAAENFRVSQKAPQSMVIAWCVVYVCSIVTVALWREIIAFVALCVRNAR